MGLFALLWLNLRVRWREWRTGDADGVFLQQMRGLWGAEAIRPRSVHKLRLARLDRGASGGRLRLRGDRNATAKKVA
jgi:hypothetical protein